jgi:amidase
MQLLEPGFTVAASPAVSLGRLRPAGTDVDPVIDAAVDQALRAAGLPATELELTGWQDAASATYAVMDHEAIGGNGWLLADPEREAALGENTRERLIGASFVTDQQAELGRAFQVRWKAAFDQLFAQAQLLVLATVPAFPGPVADGDNGGHTRCTAPLNLAGLPALALPVPAQHRLPASLQLVGPPGSEELLLATGAIIEAAAGYQRP